MMIISSPMGYEPFLSLGKQRIDEIVLKGLSAHRRVHLQDDEAIEKYEISGFRQTIMMSYSPYPGKFLIPAGF